jgi:hypothetical protein
MYNFNYEYMTFLRVVHVYMSCNVVLYCVALPARVLFAIKIIILLLLKLIFFISLKSTKITFSKYSPEVISYPIFFKFSPLKGNLR